jgi:hypothetical protein
MLPPLISTTKASNDEHFGAHSRSFGTCCPTLRVSQTKPKSKPRAKPKAAAKKSKPRTRGAKTTAKRSGGKKRR